MTLAAEMDDEIGCEAQCQLFGENCTGFAYRESDKACNVYAAAAVHPRDVGGVLAKSVFKEGETEARVAKGSDFGVLPLFQCYANKFHNGVKPWNEVEIDFATARPRGMELLRRYREHDSLTAYARSVLLENAKITVGKPNEKHAYKITLRIREGSGSNFVDDVLPVWRTYSDFSILNQHLKASYDRVQKYAFPTIDDVVMNAGACTALRTWLKSIARDSGLLDEPEVQRFLGMRQMFTAVVTPNAGQTRRSPYKLQLLKESDAPDAKPHIVQRTYAEFDALRTALMADAVHGEWVKSLEFPTERTGVFGGFDDALMISKMFTDWANFILDKHALMVRCILSHGAMTMALSAVLTHRAAALVFLSTRLICCLLTPPAARTHSRSAEQRPSGHFLRPAPVRPVRVPGVARREHVRGDGRGRKPWRQPHAKLQDRLHSHSGCVVGAWLPCTLLWTMACGIGSERALS